MNKRFDCLIIGGGHNGLVAAAYLARAGKKVCVLERRHVLGGCSATEELWPGFKISVASYVISLFRPEIIRDLRLDERPEFNPALRQASVVDEIRATLRGLVSSDKSSQPAGDRLEPIIQAYYNALSVWPDGPSAVLQDRFTSGLR